MKRGAMKNISLAMLARQIGVGVATVDRVLNERGWLIAADHAQSAAGGARGGTEADPAGGAPLSLAD